MREEQDNSVAQVKRVRFSLSTLLWLITWFCVVFACASYLTVLHAIGVGILFAFVLVGFRRCLSRGRSFQKGDRARYAVMATTALAGIAFVILVHIVENVPRQREHRRRVDAFVTAVNWSITKDDRFQRVTVKCESYRWGVEISGSVPSQAALSELQRIVWNHGFSDDVVWDVRIEE